MFWVWVVLQVVAAVVYGNLMEWILHKYVLHGIGIKKRFFAEHWYRHHKHARTMDYYDPDYDGWNWSWDSRMSEVVGLVVVAIAHSWLVLVAPVFFAGLVLWTFLYYAVHSISHAKPKLGAKLFPWHYDHHMGKNQNANWCVTFPLWDWILRTRVVY